MRLNDFNEHHNIFFAKLCSVMAPTNTPSIWLRRISQAFANARFKGQVNV